MKVEDAQIIQLTDEFFGRQDEDTMLEWFTYLFNREYPEYEIDERYTEVEKSGTSVLNERLTEVWTAQTMGYAPVGELVKV